MKPIFGKLLRWVEKLGDLVLFKTAFARRSLLKAQAREQQAHEAERLDRLRNPHEYRGR